MEKLINAEKRREYFSPKPSLRTVRNWQKARLIPYIKIGGKVYFDPASVMETLAKKRTINPR